MGLSSYRLNAFIAVTEMTRAEEFYEGKLGLPVVRPDADGSKAMRQAVSSRWLSTRFRPRRPVDRDPGDLVRRRRRAGGGRADLERRDLRAIRRRLESGFDYGTDEKGISPRAGGGKVAWFKDPDGNTFSIEGDR